MTMTATKPNHALTNAEGQLENIIELYKLSQVEDDERDIEQEARDMALDVCYRSQEWLAVGKKEDFEPTQGRVLLSYGGPSCQVTCDLENGWPVNPEIQWQDWGTPWTFAHIRQDLGLDYDEGNKALVWFINLFYWGE